MLALRSLRQEDLELEACLSSIMICCIKEERVGWHEDSRGKSASVQTDHLISITRTQSRREKTLLKVSL